MINRNDGSITIIDENHNNISAHFIFNFEVPEFNKRYLVYTLNTHNSDKQLTVLISEINFDTYEIKSIPESDLTTVMECYNNIINAMINEE